MTETPKNNNLFPLRRVARMIALQMLYINEFNPQELPGLKKILSLFERTITDEDLEIKKEERKETPPLFNSKTYNVKFADALVETIISNSVSIDKLLREIIRHWKIERLSVIDRNILRLGAVELLFFGDIPPKVTINEYIEVAKYFGDLDSAGFVNGILDRIAREHAENPSAL